MRSSASGHLNLEEITINGKKYHQVLITVTYSVFTSHFHIKYSSLIDHCAKSSVPGADEHIIEVTLQLVVVEGINSLLIHPYSLVVLSSLDIMDQLLASCINIHTLDMEVHSTTQLEWHQNDANTMADPSTFQVDCNELTWTSKKIKTCNKITQDRLCWLGD